MEPCIVVAVLSLAAMGVATVRSIYWTRRYVAEANAAVAFAEQAIAFWREEARRSIQREAEIRSKILRGEA